MCQFISQCHFPDSLILRVRAYMQHDKVVIWQPGQILFGHHIHLNGQRTLDHIQLVVGPALKLLHLNITSQLDQRGICLIEQQLGHQDILHLDILGIRARQGGLA